MQSAGYESEYLGKDQLVASLATSCRHTVDLDSAAPKSLCDPRLYRALHCSKCRTRDAPMHLNA